MNQLPRGTNTPIKKSIDPCHVTVLLLKARNLGVRQQFYDTLLTYSGEISIGNLFEVSDNPIEIEDQLSQIIQMQETMTLLNPNMRHLLLIVEISSHLVAMPKIGSLSPTVYASLLPTVYTEATNGTIYLSCKSTTATKSIECYRLGTPSGACYQSSSRRISARKRT
jgi:hypothetical protein